MAERTDANRSRERMKQEVMYLRETVAQLETQLTQMRTQQHVAHVLAVAPAGDASVRAQAIADAAWQDIAERQRRMRYEAEVENNKLRSYLEDQIRLGKTLEKLLHRRQHAEVESMLSRRLDAQPSSRVETRSPLEDAQVARDLKASLVDQLADAEAIFSGDMFTREVGPFRHIDLRYRDDVGTYVETCERRILPFDGWVVSNALLYQFDAQNQRTHTIKDMTHGEYVEYDLVSMIDTARFRGISRTKLIVQRVVVRGSTYFLYAGLGDPGESLGTSCEGLYVRHRGWTRLRELPKPDSDPSCPTVTEYATYHISSPEVYDLVPDQKRKIGTLTNYVLATIGFQMDVGRESIDNYLLAHAMSSNSPAPSHSSDEWEMKRPAHAPPLRSV